MKRQAFAVGKTPERKDGTTSGRRTLAAVEENDDAALMAAIAAGDRDAFARLAARHMDMISRYAYGVLGERATADDVTQETLLRLWRNADKWQPSGRVRSWLLRIAHNLCIDQMRSRRRNVALDTFEETLPSTAPGAATAIQETQVSRLVKQALFTLPDRQREALMLVHYSSLSNIEAARIMDVTVDALESLLARGKKQLRQLLAADKNLLLED